MCGKTPFVRLAAAHHAPFFCKICASAITLVPKNFIRITSRKYPREEFFRFPPTRGTIFVHKIASRRPAERISYTKLLPANPRNDFRTPNCSPPTRGTIFVHKIASRRPAERISYTELLSDSRFCAKKSFFGFPRLVWRKRILLLSNPR